MIVLTAAERMNTAPLILPDVSAAHVVPSSDVSHAADDVTRQSCAGSAYTTFCVNTVGGPTGTNCVISALHSQLN